MRILNHCLALNAMG